MSDGQAFEACLQIGGVNSGFAWLVCLPRACGVRAAFLFEHVVLGLRHAAFSRTLGDRAIVTGYPVTWPTDHANERCKLSVGTSAARR